MLIIKQIDHKIIRTNITLYLHLGYNLEHLNHDKKVKEQNELILLNNQKEIIVKLKVNFTLENVKKSFYNTANQFLQETDNYI